MDDREYEKLTRDQARVFGERLSYLRREVYKEGLRDWGKRLGGLSASYLGKLEQGTEVGVPKRRTVIEMARALNIDEADFQLAAGYVPLGAGGRSADTSFNLLVASLDDGQRAAVRSFIELVRREGIRKT